MNNVKLLDCTLRDGGYVNDWLFGHDTMISVVERLVGAGIDIIEVGFLDERRAFDMDRSIMPDTQSAAKIFHGVETKGAMILGMIDYGTCPISRLQPCGESILDGIRVIFKKELMTDALRFCGEVQALGYKVFANCVSITSYNEYELKELIDLINGVSPYAVSMVDTYGLLHQEGLMKIFEVMDRHLNPEIGLAYHAHNNFQMGYANGIEFISRNTDRALIVDGTLFGMGKSAGNTPLELLAMYMNERFGTRYDISLLLDAIDMNLMEIHDRSPWGYKPFYFIAASQKCHPNYVSFLINKGTLSMKAINELLSRLEEPKRLLYDQKRIDALYLNYQRDECDDTAARTALNSVLAGRDVLVIGPGKSVRENGEKIQSHITRHHPVIIAINSLPEEYCADYVFATNNKRYTKLLAQLVKPENRSVQLIATSNLSRVNREFSFVLNYGSLIDAATEIPDNSLVMLLKTLLEASVKSVALAGFDGYTHGECNYLNAEMEYGFVHDKVDYLNEYNSLFIKNNAEKLGLTFVTPSVYEAAI
jgi:4-hydroxy 2-oxovalerate aldolase